MTVFLIFAAGGVFALLVQHLVERVERRRHPNREAERAKAEAEREKAELREVLDTMARHRVGECVRHVDAAIAAVRTCALTSPDRAALADKLLDARQALTGEQVLS